MSKFLISLCLVTSGTLSIAMAQNAAVPLTSESLTRERAEELALRNNPQITVAHLLALAQHQVVREARAGELPTLTGSVTAEAAEDGSRVASGGLSDSRLFQHVGGGVSLSQLITDFGHTRNLLASAKLQELAQNATERASRAQIILATDQTFYSALQAQALLRVAQQTVSSRQVTQAQVNQLAQNKLRSTLDLSFADVTLSQAQLLQLDAVNQANATMADLDEVLGLDHEVHYTLVAAGEEAPPPPPDVEVLVQLALQHRPDLQSLALKHQADEKFTQAQKDQVRPTLTALGTLGGTPVRPGEYFRSSWDGGIATNLSVPVFNGFLFSAQAREARLRAGAANEQTRQLRNQIVRDVQTSWLQANNAFQRIAVTAALLNQSNQSLHLAETRYQLGLSSMVELSQSQLQQTEAEIDHTNAEFQYRLSLARLNFQIGAQL